MTKGNRKKQPSANCAEPIQLLKICTSVHMFGRSKNSKEFPRAGFETDGNFSSVTTGATFAIPDVSVITMIL